MSYNLLCSELKIRNKGEVEHHVIPKSVMKENNFLTVKCTPQEHLYAHLLYDRETNKSTRWGLWSSFSRKDEVNWETCSYEDLNGFDEDWKLHNLHISQAKKGCKGYWEGKKRPPFSNEWKQRISEGGKGKHIGDLNPSKRPEVREKISKSRSKFLYRIQTPSGTIEETTSITEYCRLHNLDNSTMYETKHTKGYYLLSKEVLNG